MPPPDKLLPKFNEASSINIYIYMILYIYNIHTHIYLCIYIYVYTQSSSINGKFVEFLSWRYAASLKYLTAPNLIKRDLMYTYIHIYI